MITDRSAIDKIVERCEVCYVSMCGTDGKPYVVPFNFGYDGRTLYLHSAQEGRKMSNLKKNPAVCIAFSTDHQLRHQHHEVACSYGMRYRSVLMHGEVEFISSFERKQEVLNIIMKKYTGREFTFNAPSIHEVAVYQVNISEITGRESGY